MSRLANSVLAGMLAVSAADVFAQETGDPELAKKRAPAIFAPKPKYGAGWPEGSGVFVLNVNKESGEVKSVDIAQSTGHKVLDDSAVEAFQKWRFKPGSIAPKIKIPISFSHHALEDLWASARAQALFTPRPDYPDAARNRAITGEGVFVAKLDTKTGNVLSVSTLKSTGNELLDQAALKALQQWRFKPGRLMIVRVPIRFSNAGVEF